MDFFVCCFCDYFSFPFSNKNLVILFHIDSASITICFDNYSSIVSVCFFFAGWLSSLLTHFGLSKLTILQYKFIPMSETQMRILVIHSCFLFIYEIFAAVVKGKQRLNLNLITESTNESCNRTYRVLRKLSCSSLISLYKIELRLFWLQKVLSRLRIW